MYMMASSSWWRRRALMILCVLQLPVSHGCWKEERAALMQIRASLVGTNSSAWLPLIPWGDQAGKNSCLWELVTCSDVTGRVSHLDLSNIIASTSRSSWSLDSNIFSAFPELQYLDLSYNNLSLLSFNGFKSLNNLRELDLSNNNINGNLPSFLFSLPRIKRLALSYNMVEGHIPINSSSNLSLSLTSLQLSRNKLSGIFSFLWLNSLKNLAEIDLSRNANLRVIVNIPGWVPQFQLKYLGLSGCDLDKDIIAKPHFLGTQHLLEDLHLSDNNLFGGMPNWLFTKASTLVSVDLRKNSLTGPLDPIWYPQTSLQYIRVSMNNIEGQLPTNMSSVFPNLAIIDFSNNNFFGEIPMSLCHINTIEFLQLDNNKFSGEMPTCLFTDLPNLLILMVSNNHLGGPILGGRSNLSIGGSTGSAMHLDGNKFEGALPRNLSAEGLWIMDLHDNMISGEFDASSWSLSNLLYLNVAGNLITGEISPQICTIPGIEYLDLSNNRFNGPLLSSCNSTSLVSLNLSTNSLSGEVLWEHFNTPILFNLDVRHNMLTGNLTWVHSFTWMGVLSLGYNKFYGQIPLSLCELRYLRIIDLSYNMLSGLVPPCIGAMYFQNNSPFIEMFTPPNTEAYEVVIEAEGRFTFSTKGRELTYSHTIGLMSGIDLSGNLLSGNIPPELGNLSHVKSLNLSHNALVGTIPASLATMSDLESLDLSYNELTGSIPPELTRLRSLEVFSVAYNQLSGCLPRSGQFDTFDVDSYEGNSLLDMKCSSVPSGLESCPIPPCDKMVVDVGPYAATAASFVLAFWATVAFSFCHSTGRRIVLKL